MTPWVLYMYFLSPFPYDWGLHGLPVWEKDSIDLVAPMFWNHLFSSIRSTGNFPFGKNDIMPGVLLVYKLQKTNPKSKIQNIQSNRKTKNQKSKRDDNRHERKRTWNRGGKSKRCICYEHDVQWRSSYSRYRQTIPQHGPTQWGHCPRLLSLSCFGRFM